MIRWLIVELNRPRFTDPGTWREMLVTAIMLVTVTLGYFWLIGDLP